MGYDYIVHAIVPRNQVNGVNAAMSVNHGPNNINVPLIGINDANDAEPSYYACSSVVDTTLLNTLSQRVSEFPGTILFICNKNELLISSNLQQSSNMINKIVTFDIAISLIGLRKSPRPEIEVL